MAAHVRSTSRLCSPKPPSTSTTIPASVHISCTRTLPLSPEDIASRILDLSKWHDFKGYGPIPGIRSATFAVRTTEVTGTRIRVENLDGSTHVEEIVEWDPHKKVRLHFQQFSPPLASLAESFLETWEFEITGAGTKVVRSFQLHPRNPAAWAVLWVISRFLKEAIRTHLDQMGKAAHL
ncbi:MAG: SRPBCC family protein [Verrucomicrobiales bacterium]